MSCLVLLVKEINSSSLVKFAREKQVKEYYLVNADLVLDIAVEYIQYIHHMLQKAYFKLFSLIYRPQLIKFPD